MPFLFFFVSFLIVLVIWSNACARSFFFFCSSFLSFCMLDLRAVATCFVKIRTTSRSASGDVLHLRDIRVLTYFIDTHTSARRPCLQFDVFFRHELSWFLCICIVCMFKISLLIEIASNDHGIWPDQLIRYRTLVVFNLSVQDGLDD